MPLPIWSRKSPALAASLAERPKYQSTSFTRIITAFQESSTPSQSRNPSTERPGRPSPSSQSHSTPALATQISRFSRTNKENAMRTLASTLLLILVCTCAIAQGPKTGFPPTGSFQNGSFDTTNLQNLNTFFQIPIVSSPGRGVNFSFAITYNTAMWSNTGYLGAWTPVTNINGASWGWNLMPSLGFFPFYANDTGCWYDHETEWGSYTTSPNCVQGSARHKSHV